MKTFKGPWSEQRFEKYEDLLNNLKKRKQTNAAWKSEG